MRLHSAVAALLPAIALVLVPSPAMAASKRPAANLEITRIVVKHLPGDPPYMAIDGGGHAPGFVVRVITTNTGHAKSAKSRTQLELTARGDRLWAMTERVPALRRGEAHRSVFKVNDLTPKLGWVTPRAEADAEGAVPESREHDNRLRGRPITVVARRWKVSDFMTTTDLGDSFFGPGGVGSTATKTLDGSDFRLSQYNEQDQLFEYVPEGPIRASLDYVYAPLLCTAHGGINLPQNRWPGYLRIDRYLAHYEALVTDKDPALPAVEIYCKGQPILPATWGFQNLITFLGAKVEPEMSPFDTTLTGLKTAPGPEVGTNTTWQWAFKADVPSR